VASKSKAQCFRLQHFVNPRRSRKYIEWDVVLITSGLVCSQSMRHALNKFEADVFVPHLDSVVRHQTETCFQHLQLVEEVRKMVRALGKDLIRSLRKEFSELVVLSFSLTHNSVHYLSKRAC
jgi:hypothetical protein